MAIVRTSYRYKRPPRKRKTAAIEVPLIVTIPREKLRRVAKADEANAERKSAIVTAKHPRRPSRFADVPDMTPEEHKQRGDAADELLRRFKREIAATKR